MFKVLVLLALIAVVYSVPAPLTQAQLEAEGPRSQVNLPVDESIKAANGEIDPKNEKEELEGAEFKWGFKKFGGWGGGWGYPSYRSYNYYPSDYYPSYYYPSYSNWW